MKAFNDWIAATHPDATSEDRICYEAAWREAVESAARVVVNSPSLVKSEQDLVSREIRSELLVI